MYEKFLTAGWGDMDFNGHMGNAAYLHRSSDVRMMYFAENGFPVEEFVRQHFGPVIMKDELEYFRENRLLEVLRVTFACAGLAEDGSRFKVRNEVWCPDGKLSARVTSTGGWLDLAARKLICPPDALDAAMHSLERTADFEVLPPSVK